ncbi:hypothetical protein BSKO_07168 [Bryopsis sp. KO-2023]|nr:hypothetical protein BSKO_07168 [Bryopsis sp. KO-2023]
MGKRYSSLALVLLLSVSAWSVRCQVTDPKSINTPPDQQENKFQQRKAELDDSAAGKRAEQDDEEVESINYCSQNLHLKWMTEVSSTVYGTPIITDLFSDGHKDIIVPAFSSYLEVLEAEDGAKAVDWPAYHKATVHGSPFMFDIDRDGILDVGVATYEGEIVWFNDNADRLQDTLFVPKLRVKKNWYVGLNPDPTDHSHPDVGQGISFEGHGKPAHTKVQMEPSNSTSNSTNTTSRRRLLQNEATVGATVEQEQGKEVSQEAADSFEVFNDDETFEDLEAHHGDEEDEIDRNGIYTLDEDYGDLYDHYAEDDFWDHKEVQKYYNAQPGTSDSEAVFLDAHILGTPTIADLDGDQAEELVVPVTYFFDEDHYKMPEHKDELNKDVDVLKYLANGLVVFDLFHKTIKWSLHLELTTDTIDYRAYIFGRPTVVDIDEDGFMEIIVGTSQGFLYVLDHKGRNREGWPIQMGQIEGQVLVADVNGDGEIEIVAADRHGSVAMFNIYGKELWERHLKSSIAQAPVAGDIDGDGQIEIVITSRSGHVFALEGANGQDKAPFPFKTQGTIVAPPLITRLQDSPSQQIVVPSFDGFLYVIDGETGCVDAIDFGEMSYSMVLADDLDDDGNIDLVVTSLNGNVYMFETGGEYSPLRTWTSEAHGTSGLLARDRMVGIAADKASREKRDVRGDRVSITFEILDNRNPQKRVAILAEGLENRGEQRSTTSHGPYNVTVLLKNVGVKEMNAGDAPVIGVMETYDLPGTYTVTIPCPRSRSTALVRLELKDKNKIVYVDEFSLSFHMHWYKLIKWLIVMPFTAMALVVFSAKSSILPYLPS